MKFFIFPLQKKNGGFTLIETMISIAIFLILAGGAYQVATVMIKGTQLNREGTSIAALADQYLEFARNLPYADVGTYYGIPHGSLADADHALSITYNNGTYSIYYEVTYIDDPADHLATTVAPNTDSAADDYKQVKLSITNTKTSKTYYFLTTVVPLGLEGLASGGALSISVTDANGDPIEGADISIDSVGLATPIHLDRVTDASGNWIEVGVPVGTNAYHIVVTNTVSGQTWSTDQTYPITGGNPNPTKPDSTVLNGQVTSLAFQIDQVSTLTVNALNTSCSVLGSVNIELRGAKLTGGTTTVSPVYKYDDSSHTTDGSGNTTFSNIEWDTYTPAIVGTTYMIYGSSPIQEVNLLPNTTELFTLILGTWTTNSFLVIVKDASTGDPIEGASVELSKSGYDTTLSTGGSLFGQNDWSGGSGQATYTDTTKYFADDGHISTTGGVKIKSSSGHASYTSGNLTSSTFDTGASAGATFSTITWKPTSQTSPATAKFQVATNNDNATWNFHGPDGSTSTYYTTSGTSIYSGDANKRYIRYKIFETASTTSPNWTHIPVITNVGINYVPSCFTSAPGQVIFPGLTTSSSYTLTISMAGYTTKVITPLTVNGGYNSQIVTLAH